MRKTIRLCWICTSYLSIATCVTKNEVANASAAGSRPMCGHRYDAFRVDGDVAERCSCAYGFVTVDCETAEELVLGRCKGDVGG